MVLASFKNILIKCQTLTIETRISSNSFSSIKCFKCRPTTIFAMHLLQIQCHDHSFFVRAVMKMLLFMCAKKRKNVGEDKHRNKETADKESWERKTVEK